MSQITFSINHLSFTYDSLAEPLFDDLTLNFHRGWTGIVGPNGAGKTTFLGLATGELLPGAGYVSKVDSTVYCSQRTDLPPENLEEFFYSGDRDAQRLISLMEIEYDWLYRWETLSHGERKRAQLGAALWTGPELLAVDEPTNHLDRETRRIIYKALKEFDRTGLIVSHDRQLLDVLCDSCLFLGPEGAVLRSGGYTKGKEQARQENESAVRKHHMLKKENARLQKEVSKRREMAKNQQARRSKKGLALKDHDARARINLARVTGRDGTGGKLLRQLDGRVTQVRDKLQNSSYVAGQKKGITIEGNRSRRDYLFHALPGKICKGEYFSLTYPELLIRPGDRIAITGRNGSGKSCLMEFLAGNLLLEEHDFFYLPQEFSVPASRDFIKKIRELPGDRLGELLSGVARLGSRPTQLLETALPSPGEIRKLFIAYHLFFRPSLILMDEPSNHLDVNALESLEEALKASGAALVMISHDDRFIHPLTSVRWEIGESGPGRYSLSIPLKN